MCARNLQFRRHFRGVRSPKNHASDDLFRARLDQMINLRHELVMLAGRIDWARLDEPLSPFYAQVGRPSISSRLMVGLHLLKSMNALSDNDGNTGKDTAKLCKNEQVGIRNWHDNRPGNPDPLHKLVESRLLRATGTSQQVSRAAVFQGGI